MVGMPVPSGVTNVVVFEPASVNVVEVAPPLTVSPPICDPLPIVVEASNMSDDEVALFGNGYEKAALWRHEPLIA